MSRIITIILLVLASFCASADVDLSAFDKLNAKIQCITDNGGLRSKKAHDVCVEKKAIAVPAMGEGKSFPYTRVGGDSVKAAMKRAVRMASTKAEKEIVVGVMTRKLVYSLHLSSDDANYLFPIMHSHYRFLTKLTKDDAEWNNHVEGKKDINFNVYKNGEFFRHMTYGDGGKTKANVEAAVKPYISTFTGKLTDKLPSHDILLPSGNIAAFLLECWNLSDRAGPLPPPELPVKVAPPKPQLPPSISIRKDENQKRAVAIAEINAGVWGGCYWGSQYGGCFEGTKDLLYVPISGIMNWEEQVSVGVGIYGARENGKSKTSDYGGHSSRMMPTIAVKGNGFGGVGGPDVIHQWEISAGYGNDSMFGRNPTSGWNFSQQTEMAMVHLEWSEQKDEWVYGLTAETALSIDESHHATWSGQPAERRSTARIGGLVEYRFHPHLSAKLVANATFADGTTERYGAEFGGYLCARGGWSKGQDFAIACGGAGISIGQGVIPFVGANAFAGHVFNMYVENEKAKRIFYVPADYPSGNGRRLSTIPGSFTVTDPPGNDEQQKH